MRSCFAVVLLLTLPAFASTSSGVASTRGIALRDSPPRTITLLKGEVLGASELDLPADRGAHLVDLTPLSEPGRMDDLAAGGGYHSSGLPIAALLLGLIIGFGTGHLVAGDVNGFILWLVVDIVVIVAGSVLAAFVPPYGGFIFLGLVVTHIVQGITAYQEAGGGRFAQQLRERAIEVAGAEHEQPLPAVTLPRAFAFSF